MQLEHISYSHPIESRLIRQTGYLKINNCLGNNALIAQFDSVLNQLMQTRALIIDMRETPSGGNTTIARAILGRFIDREHFYQQHEYYAEEKKTGVKRSWQEIVSPRGLRYTKPLVILCDHWTGSVGEGITIGFDGMNRATVIGTPMAGLNGAIYSYELPNTKIGFSLPTERLYHIRGMPREVFRPLIQVDMTQEKPSTHDDIILDRALQYIENKSSSAFSKDKKIQTN
jgi:carboxyl-terminal processing protease